MPTRTEILDTLGASQTQVLAFFEGLGPHDLERPATASDVPGAAPWRAKDHLGHLVQSEREIQQLLRRALAGDPREVLLLMQYPPGMPLPSAIGDWDALTSAEQERLSLAVDSFNQTSLNAHQNDTLQQLAAEYVAARLELLDLLRQFSDEQLAAPVPTVVGEATAGDVFAGQARHAAQHITSVKEGLERPVGSL